MTLRALKVGDFVGYVDAPSPAVAPIPERWYLLRVRPGREGMVMRAFGTRGISFYCPMLMKRQQLARLRSRDISVPLFPGLIMLPDFDATRRELREIDNVSGLLHFGVITPYLTPKLIDDVRHIEAAANVPLSKRERLFEIGELVRIVDGPFSGWHGRIERLDTKGRIRVLLDALKRGHKVQLTECQIEPE